MSITWTDIEKLLTANGVSVNEINSKRQIFNNVPFQAMLLTVFGVITEKSFVEEKSENVLSKTAGKLKDLADLDTYELIDYIESHELNFEQASTISPQQMSLLGDDQVDKVSNSLISGLDDRDPISFALSHIVQTGFPYKKIKGKQHYERTNGDLTVTMSAPNEIGLPAGIYPRLLFIHICSEIIKNPGNRTIDFGPSLKKFVVDILGKPWTTGESGTGKRWIQTMNSLLATHFTSTFNHLSKDGKTKGLELEHVTIARRVRLWWDEDYDEMKGAQIEISDSFAEVLLNHATPLDSRALKVLADLRTPMGIDLYCWMTYRYWRMEETGNRLTRITWEALYGQMGTSSSTVKEFRRGVREALSEVKKVYPNANYRTDNDQYLILLTSPPHISPSRINKKKNSEE